jgi:hypothetical protein
MVEMCEEKPGEVIVDLFIGLGIPILKIIAGECSWQSSS